MKETWIAIKPAPVWLLFLIILFVIIADAAHSARFISHFSSNELKGNITFNLDESPEGNVLIIESLIESSVLELTLKEKDEFDHSEPIMFDWYLHSNSLNQDAIMSCSNDEMGPILSENMKTSLTANRTIILNKLNYWKIPLDELVDFPSRSSISSLIWGRSVRLKLSTFHAKMSSNPKLSNSDKAIVAKLPFSNSSAIKSPTAGAGLSKPQLANVTPSVSVAPSKPTFGPRPKSPLAGRPKPTFSPVLPRAEALVLETTIKPMSDKPDALTMKNSQIEKNETLSLATHRRIQSIFGRKTVCGNIIDTNEVKTVEAIFEAQIAGKVYLRGNEDDVTHIHLNLYHLKSKITTKHDWKILASDILDNQRHEDQCRYLQALFDPNNVDDSNCKKTEQKMCKMGDMTGKHGQVQVAGLGKSTRNNIIDVNLPLPALEGSRSLFLVIYEVQSPVAKATSNTTLLSRPNILGCAQITPAHARKLEASINMDGVRGSIKVFQRHFTEPTTISYDLFGLEGNIKHLTIQELPLTGRSSSDNSDLCSSLGSVYNPFNVPVIFDDRATTVDMIPVGNLSAKHGQLNIVDSEYEDHYMGEFFDLSVQLFGSRSIAGRSIVFHKNNGDPWICATLNHAEDLVNTAVATFYYPVVGKVTFQQLINDPHSETGVLVDIYNPNGEKDGMGHNWLVHLHPALADFYNWSQRCESSGEVYDPLLAATGLTTDIYTRQCQSGLLYEPHKCRSGDLSLKSGHKLSLANSHHNKSRFFYNDPFLPLSKINSIIGRSVVIYDENAPKQRGTRLACSTIKMSHPLRASVRTWNSGPSIPSAVLGSVVFQQESSDRSTSIKIDLSGFSGNVENYAIHNVWTLYDREFPCSNDSLYDIYDPYDTENSLRLPPSAHYGSLATVDRVKVGDMSRKHGNFEGLQVAQRSYQDANLPLFAPHSIIGRSMVLRAAVNDFRWVCGNIELDYSRSESREIIGIASFDEPRSKIAGYVRFIQLEHKDGSLSDTFVQLDLKLQSDGVHELQTSHDHNWAIFVNQVGEDAFIAADDVRCIAAGFKWNPYLAQDTLESYPNSCNLREQSACAMGDLGMRHGSLTLGPNNRRVMSDANLPLVGNYSVMGRSLIIFDSKKPSQKLACANIFPDIHLKSNVVIKRTPSFTVARFVEQMRTSLNAAEWLLVPELKATKSVANGECVQMTIHFYGQKAHQMQAELNNLVSLGTVRKSTRIGVDKISTHYKPCRAGETQLTSSATSAPLSLHLFYIMLSMVLVFIY